MCSCENAKNVDEICNQNCRDSAPTITQFNSTAVWVEWKNGTSILYGLNNAGYVIPGSNCIDDCNYKTVEMDAGGGFSGTYDPPTNFEFKILDPEKTICGSWVPKEEFKPYNPEGEEPSDLDDYRWLPDEAQMQRLPECRAPSVQDPESSPTGRRRALKERQRLHSARNNTRELAVVEQTNIFNPVYCINMGDSFIFNIENPEHYPKYMRDSVINSNPEFDYGAFIELEQQMLARINDADVTPVIFTFTFADAGNYVFYDSTNAQKILIITVMDLGETCSDPDRYVQTVSGESLSEIGVSQQDDLILKPNYWLILSIGLILLASTGFIMLIIFYCLHKDWTISDADMKRSFRDDQYAHNIYHDDPELFYAQNDFEMHKSELIDSEEDDLDNFNLDIQQDLVAAGEKYLKMYHKKKSKHKNFRNQKKAAVQQLLDEIEELIG